ncbi:DNA-directed RNA polymerase subunit delta [Virgibacillus pantothenticus]|uniref:DNA-directed RNA polymerase subunit delta n=1 Tax=Virgibacillus pantothenticus TaxID=1473 RepID=UPI002E1EAD2D|nr:DNA-directed RNA polymerase subunit delta [Virgibacillus pantothenticus]
MTVSFNQYSHEEIQQMPMIELASLLLVEEKKAFHFKDIFNRLADLKGYTKKQKQDAISQFYTDLNVDGRFLTVGENKWGLKRWYPVEKMDEEVNVAPKRKKKAKSKLDQEENLDIADDDVAILDEDLNIDLELEDDFEEEFDDEEYDEDFEETYDEEDDEAEEKK